MYTYLLVIIYYLIFIENDYARTTYLFDYSNCSRYSNFNCNVKVFEGSEVFGHFEESEKSSLAFTIGKHTIELLTKNIGVQ